MHRTHRSRVRRGHLAVLLGAGGTLLTLAVARPGWAFSHTTRHGDVTLHSVEALPAGAQETLARVEQKLEKIPFRPSSSSYDVYVCDDDWRWSLFTLFDRRSAAVARAPFVRDVIVRAADFDRNRYRRPGGAEAPATRPLDYLLAHELTHVIVTDALGPRRAHALPTWVREGYADYIAGGPTDDGRYAPYTRRVTELLDRDGWSPLSLLTSPPPSRE